MSIQGNIVKRLGESITYGTQTIKASLKESTRAVYSLANRACFIEGQTIKGNPAMACGGYFQRICDSNTYFIATLMQEPFADDVFYMYAIKCNATITIKRLSEERDSETGDLIGDGWSTIHSNIKCFKDIATRSNKATNDGLLDQTIYTLIIPHTYLISEGDRVVMKSNQNGIETDTNYKVESTGNQVEGIDLVQMTLDIR